MKKILFIALGFVFVASSGFAATLITTAATTGIGGADFKPSTNVSIVVESTPSAYSAASAHLNGTKGYAVLHDESDMTEFDCAEGSTLAVGDVTGEAARADACTGS